MTNRPYDKSERVDLSNEPVHWDLGSSLSYGEYLRLDQILSAQRPLSYEHDEMMFIIVHQNSELWMRLFLHELSGVLECVRRDNLGPSFRMLERMSRVQTQLTAVWDVLATMTPADYSAFRNVLGRSSGFQSVQYRILEFTIGNKNADVINVHRNDPASFEKLQQVLARPHCMTKCCGCSAAAAMAFRRTICHGTSASPTSRASR